MRRGHRRPDARSQAGAHRRLRGRGHPDAAGLFGYPARHDCELHCNPRKVPDDLRVRPALPFARTDHPIADSARVSARPGGASRGDRAVSGDRRQRPRRPALHDAGHRSALPSGSAALRRRVDGQMPPGRQSRRCQGDLRRFARRCPRHRRPRIQEPGVLGASNSCARRSKTTASPAL